METLKGRMTQWVMGVAMLGALAVLATAPAAAQSSTDHEGRKPAPPVACTGGSGSIAGLVTDASGNAVEGATVRVGGPSRAEATTAADGSYTVTALCVGDYRVGANKKDVGHGNHDADADGQPDKVTLTDAALAATGVNIVLVERAEGGPRHPGGPGRGPGRGPELPRPTPAPACTNGSGTIAGLVKDAAGNPVEGALVHAGGPSRARALTAADGSYQLAALCVGDYRVGAEKGRLGAGSYDADADGKPDKVTLSDTAPGASNIDITLKAKPRGGRGEDR